MRSVLRKSEPECTTQKHQFSVQPDGTISYAVVADIPTTALSVSDHKYRAQSGMAIFSSNSNQKVYDAFLRDFVYQPGRINGGIHAGGPINQPLPIVAGGGMNNVFLDEHPVNTIVFSTGPAGGCSTYISN